MKIVIIIGILLFGSVNSFAQTSVAVSSRDRVYTADQTSNTVSVIDPSANKLLGVIRLGDPVPPALSALYKGALLVHGLGFSPDSKTLAVVSVGSNSVTLIDTATNKIKGTVYVGRSPHEAFFTPDGKELWVSVRGEDYISVVDPVAMKEVRQIKVANGPGMVIFRPDGKYAFICSSFSPETAVVDTSNYEVIKRLPQASSFSPNIAVSQDGKEFWLTLKDASKTQAFSAEPPFDQIAVLETGSISNHVIFADNRNGKFAYVTIGGLNEVKVYRRGTKPELIAQIPVGDLPHGIWRSGDGSRVYVALENGGAVQAIDTLINKVIATIPAGQTSQALVYVPNAVPSGAGTDNLVPLGQAADVFKFDLKAVAGSASSRGASATVAVNSLGALDLLQIAVSGLQPKTQYTVSLSDTNQPPFKNLVPLANFTTWQDGGGVAQAIGPLKKIVTNASQIGQEAVQRRYLIVSPTADVSNPVLIEKTDR
jgi:YVTN family beta-propeller protein